MNERLLLHRKYFLKGQAIRLIRHEREEILNRLALLRIRDGLLKKMKAEFDPKLTIDLDCVDHLLGS